MKQPPAEIIVLLANDILDDRECDPLLWIPGLEHDYMPEFCTSYTRTDIVDRLRAENAGMVKVSTELAAEAKRLMARLEKARGMGQQLVDDGECGYEITQRWHTWLTEKDE